MTRSVGEIDNICRKSSYKIDKSHGATYMLIGPAALADAGDKLICSSLVQKSYLYLTSMLQL